PVKNWSGTAHAAPLRLKLQYFPTKGLFCAVRTIWGTPYYIRGCFPIFASLKEQTKSPLRSFKIRFLHGSFYASS
ncbi:hypothetical protein, partial [Flintibacter porci]|uniref:hypothetical protein n=1 Tax=Flintibacter porci TaxID=3342383 RepID=UPI003F8AFF3A